MKNREPDAADRKIAIGTIAVVLIFYVLVALGSF